MKKLTCTLAALVIASMATSAAALNVDPNNYEVPSNANAATTNAQAALQNQGATPANTSGSQGIDPAASAPAGTSPAYSNSQTTDASANAQYPSAMQGPPARTAANTNPNYAPPSPSYAPTSRETAGINGANSNPAYAPTSGAATAGNVPANDPPANATGQAVTPANATGQAVTPANATGQAVTPANATGQAVTPANATGQAVTPANATGQAATPANTKGIYPPIRAEKTKAASDKKITKVVKHRYEDYDYLDPRYVDVDTENGVVTVSGFVEEDPEYEQAYFLAATAPAVRDVDFKDLEVENPEASEEDREMNAHVKVVLYERGFAEDEDLSKWSFKTRAEEGTVYIDGKLPNEETREEIAEILYENPEVESVKTNVEYY